MSYSIEKEYVIHPALPKTIPISIKKQNYYYYLNHGISIETDNTPIRVNVFTMAEKICFRSSERHTKIIEFNSSTLSEIISWNINGSFSNSFPEDMIVEVDLEGVNSKLELTERLFNIDLAFKVVPSLIGKHEHSGKVHVTCSTVADPLTRLYTIFAKQPIMCIEEFKPFMKKGKNETENILIRNNGDEQLNISIALNDKPFKELLIQPKASQNLPIKIEETLEEIILTFTTNERSVDENNQVIIGRTETRLFSVFDARNMDYSIDMFEYPIKFARIGENIETSFSEFIKLSNYSSPLNIAIACLAWSCGISFDQIKAHKNFSDFDKLRATRWNQEIIYGDQQ